MQELVEIVPYRPWMRRDVLEITYETGFYGKDPARAGVQVDSYLFTQCFGNYYLRYEPDLAFVASVDGQVVGYIIGTRDTSRYHSHVQETVLPICMRRLSRLRFGVSPQPGDKMDIDDTSMFERSIERALVSGLLPSEVDPVQQHIERSFPAHLHINVRSDAQRGGVGSALMNRFLATLAHEGVKGVHLVTTLRNTRAIPFYKKLGFDMVYSRTADSIWPDDGSIQVVTFTKELPGT